MQKLKMMARRINFGIFFSYQYIKGTIIIINNAYKVVNQNLPALLLLFFLVSCVYNPDITGKWQEPGKTSSIEFRQDGTFTAIDDMGMTVNGNYTLQAKGKIRLEIKHPNSSVETIIGSIAVQGDKLILAHEEEKEILVYKKTK